MTIPPVVCCHDIAATNATIAMKAYLSVTEIAKVTQKERSTIVRWIKAGRFGKVLKLGNEYQVAHESFKRWWDKNMRSIKSNDEQK
ncbi:MAG: helix-turn-helix domain-containing protein [Nitrososphaera sp.]|nr:helix-turn-helix domain-containing protein [Nitrososphaera sp.]